MQFCRNSTQISRLLWYCHTVEIENLKFETPAMSFESGPDLNRLQGELSTKLPVFIVYSRNAVGKFWKCYSADEILLHSAKQIFCRLLDRASNLPLSAVVYQASQYTSAMPDLRMLFNNISSAFAYFCLRALKP